MKHDTSKELKGSSLQNLGMQCASKILMHTSYKSQSWINIKTETNGYMVKLTFFFFSYF